MAFKGIFDGSVQIGQAREERATQMAMQRRQIQAQLAMQQAQLKASTAQANADRALKSQAMGMENNLATKKLDMQGDELAMKQQEFDAGKSLRDTQQATAKMMLQKAQQDFEEDQAQRASLTQFRQSAFGAGVLSAMLNGVAPTKTLSEINRANGIADGEPGSIVGMGGGPEGAWYDVVAQDAQGQPAKARQQVDPMALMAIATQLLGKDGAKDWASMYRAKDTNNTKMNLALEAYEKAMMQEEMRTQRTLAGEGAKTDRAVTVEGMKTDRAVQLQDMKTLAAKALGADAAKITVNGKLLETLNEQALEVEDKIASLKKKKQPVPADLLTAQKETMEALRGVRSLLTPDKEGETGATAEEAPAVAVESATLEGGNIVVVRGGKRYTYKDTPEARKALEKMGMTL
jgi:hypothetical protein